MSQSFTVIYYLTSEYTNFENITAEIGVEAFVRKFLVQNIPTVQCTAGPSVY